MNLFNKIQQLCVGLRIMSKPLSMYIRPLMIWSQLISILISYSCFLHSLFLLIQTYSQPPNMQCFSPFTHFLLYTSTSFSAWDSNFSSRISSFAKVTIKSFDSVYGVIASSWVVPQCFAYTCDFNTHVVLLSNVFLPILITCALTGGTTSYHFVTFLHST